MKPITQGLSCTSAQAIVDSERRQDPPDQRIALRLELGEAQRMQFVDGGDTQKLAAAEASVRSAYDLASRTNERELLAESLDKLSLIEEDRGHLDEAARLLEEAGVIETKGKSDALACRSPAASFGVAAAAAG